MRDIVQRTVGVRRQEQDQERLADIQREYSRNDLELQMYRRWMVGDVYAPHDLSGLEQSKWKRFRRRTKPKQDVFDQLGINPIQHYKVCLGG